MYYIDIEESVGSWLSVSRKDSLSEAITVCRSLNLVINSRVVDSSGEVFYTTKVDRFDCFPEE